MRHNADPSLANKDNQTPLELAESKNRLDILDVLRKTSPLLQNSDESLSQGSQTERIEDIDDIESIEIPEQTSPTDPYSRYKNPEKVLKKLGRSSFEELPEHLNMDMLRRLQEPKVKEVKSKRLTPAERKKKKWTVTTAGEEQKKMQEMRAKSSQNDKIDTDSLLEEAEQAALKEQEEQKMKNQKKKKSAPPPPPPSSSATSSQKFVPKEEPLPKEKESDTESEKPIKTKEEKQSPKQKKVENPKPVEKSEPPKKPQNRGKKIKKDLKRVQSSSTSSDNSENEEDDDEIIVMPSFQNKPQQSKSHTKSEQPPETPSIQETQPQIQPQPQQQQPLQPSQQPSNQAESSFSLDQLKKFMDGYLSERQSQSQPQQPQQPQVHYALPPGAYFVPAPGINQPIAIPTMPQMQQIPAYNPMQPYLGVGSLPMGMKLPNQLPQQQPQAGMNVTRSEMQKLEARIASLEQIFAPAMRQFQMGGPMSSQIQLGTCQNCKTLNATSVCPRCGIQLCNGCRDIHNNQRCK